MNTANQTAETKQRNEKSHFTDEVKIFNVAENDLEQFREDLVREKDARLRLAAEYENYRRRTKREMTLAAEAGKRELLERLVSLADDFDLALANLDQSGDALAEGLRMIERRFRETLEANGVVGFESKGEKFDPERHEAFDVVVGAENESGTVQAEIRRGYFWHDKLLRPALVVVAR